MRHIKGGGARGEKERRGIESPGKIRWSRSNKKISRTQQYTKQNN